MKTKKTETETMKDEVNCAMRHLLGLSGILIEGSRREHGDMMVSHEFTSDAISRAQNAVGPVLEWVSIVLDDPKEFLGYLTHAQLLEMRRALTEVYEVDNDGKEE